MTDRTSEAARVPAALVRARPGVEGKSKKALLTGGGVLGAMAMSSCCILPLALFSLGVTGAWIGNLAALYPYKLYFFLATAVFLAGGFHQAYRKPKADACQSEPSCAAPISDRINKALLWSATVLVLAALAFPYYAPLLLES